MWYLFWPNHISNEYVRPDIVKRAKFSNLITYPWYIKSNLIQPDLIFLLVRTLKNKLPREETPPIQKDAETAKETKQELV